MDSNPIVAALDQAGFRRTPARRTVAEVIVAREGHFTAEDVLADARRRRRAMGRATVFRSLDLLARMRLVERVDLPSGEHAYVACLPSTHHHHVLCSRCGRSADVGDVGLSPILERVAASTGYRIDTHRLELFGLCPDCRSTIERGA